MSEPVSEPVSEPTRGLHEPVLLNETVEDLVWRLDGVYIDGTTGTGGHSAKILGTLGPNGRLLCVDQDPGPLAIAAERLGADPRVSFHRASFSELDPILREAGLDSVDGILLDLGLNAWSLTRPENGLSYTIDAPLNMKLDPDLPFTAAEYLARVRLEDLRALFAEYGNPRRAGLYAKRLIDARPQGRLQTTSELVRALAGPRREVLAPAELSRVFGALRIAINQEMERLDAFLLQAGRWIAPGGRLVVIAYASHEDRRVKRAFVQAKDSPFAPRRKKPLVAGPAEVARNRKARSAKLRVFERRETR